ncbi:phage holin, lambda family [Xenorhabdus bovienii]|uniref:phage holin, lambda family n=1 Tax=Xenorhabdus bovienii TaxID=40576 RepID=UPI003B982618
MKMKENPDIWVHLGNWLVSIKEQGVGSVLAGTMAFLRGRYNGGGWLKVSIDAFMCAMFAWFIRDVLNLFGLNPDLAYIGSVMMGYLGTDFIGQLLCKAAEKKTGASSDGNQR